MIEPRFTLLVLCLLAAACGPAPPDAGGRCAGISPPAIEPPAIDLEAPRVSRHNLRAWVELLTSNELRGRHAGEAGARDAAALVAAEMARVGLVPPADPGGGYCRGFPFLDEEDYNVVGHLPSSDGTTGAPAGGRLILLGAHYDGQGVHPAGMVYPGADDNASGVAALLEVARLAIRRSAAGPATSQPVWSFVAFGAEEGGRQGSRAYLSAPPVDLSRVELAINLDMIGRPLPGHGDEIGYRLLGASATATLARLRAAAARSGQEIRPLEDAGELMPAISDAQVLAERLPALLLSTALHADHHQLTDTPEKIDYAQIERAVRLVLALGDIIPAF